MTRRAESRQGDARYRFFITRPRWLLIIVALLIIAMAAIGLQFVDTSTQSPLQSTPDVAASTERVSPSDTIDFTFTCSEDICSFTYVGSDAAAWRWDFGDGEYIEGKSSVTHAYSDEEVYIVSLSITDDSGTSQIVSRGVNSGELPAENDVSGVSPPVYPFGPHIGSSGGWDLLGEVFTAAHVSPTPETVIDELNAARADGKSIILLLARSAPNYKDDDGTFNLAKWKAEIDLYADLDFSQWIGDGTLLAHYLISEPMSRGRWGGQVVQAKTLDEMARYSKERWPSLATVVRERPTDLMTHAGGYETGVPGWRWTYLDAGWARYSARMGPIDEYIDAEVRAARSQNLGLVFGLNVLAGGDGSSQKVGYEGGWLMSPDELMDYGTKIIAEPYGCGNIMWHLNHDGIPYFGVPEIDVVVEDLGLKARAREPIPCSVSEPSS